MEEMLPDMTTNNPSSSSTLRLLRLVKTPELASFGPTRSHDPLELHESDVVWSFSVSSDSYPYPTSFPSRRHGFNPAKPGLSTTLSADRHHLVSQKSAARPRVIPQATRQEDFPAKFHRSAPINIPVWPKNLRHFKRFDKMEDGDEVNGGEEKEMVPPHVIVARSHVTFSVFEGAGRTLKGRDLRRVRNAVFRKTGLID